MDVGRRGLVCLINVRWLPYGPVVSPPEKEASAGKTSNNWFVRVLHNYAIPDQLIPG
jgi:hypothetical protein